VFARIKQSRHGEYLQIVENYRDGDRVRQRLVMYVGHYPSVEAALAEMPRERVYKRRQATKAEHAANRHPESDALREQARALREEADEVARKLEDLQDLVEKDPALVERDRARAERHAQRRARAMAGGQPALPSGSDPLLVTTY
jgi:hypothetical protein